MPITIDLIRHGEPLGGQMYRGQLDHPLSDKGWKQMRDAVADHAPWDRIITSPLLRCAEFAHELGLRHDIEVAEDPRLSEVGFGAWEGFTGDELRAADPDQIRRFYTDPIDSRPEGAEPLQAFRQRVAECIDDVLGLYEGRHVLLVCHAGVIRAVLSHVLQAPLHTLYRLTVGNAGLTRLQSTHERPLFIAFHDRARL